jgi:hypothetical protein
MDGKGLNQAFGELCTYYYPKRFCSPAEAQAAMTAFVAEKAHEAPQREQKLELIYDPLAKAYRDNSGRFVDQRTAQAIIERHEREASESYRDAATEAELRAKLLRGEISLTDALEQVEDKLLARREQRTWAEATAAALAEDGPLAMWPEFAQHLASLDLKAKMRYAGRRQDRHTGNHRQPRIRSDPISAAGSDGSFIMP